jgi:hypothetical protein
MKVDIFSRKGYRSMAVGIIGLLIISLLIIFSESGKDQLTAILFLGLADLFFSYQFYRTVMLAHDDNNLYLSGLKGEFVVPFDRIIRIKKNGSTFSSAGGNPFMALTLYFSDGSDKKRSVLFFVPVLNGQAFKDLKIRLKFKIPNVQVEDLS